MTLSDKDRLWLAFIERQYYETGIFPELAAIAVHNDSTIPDVAVWLKMPRIQKALEDRGMDWAVQTGGQASRTLSPAQIAIALSMMNPDDKRDRAKKLKAHGVSLVQYQAWCRNPAFVAFCNQVGQNAVVSSIADAHTSLAKNVQRGDLNSIKYLFEMTDTYNPRKDAQIDLMRLMTQIIEIIQRRVVDPEVQKEIASDMAQLAPRRELISG